MPAKQDEDAVVRFGLGSQGLERLGDVRPGRPPSRLVWPAEERRHVGGRKPEPLGIGQPLGPCWDVIARPVQLGHRSVVRIDRAADEQSMLLGRVEPQVPGQGGWRRDQSHRPARQSDEHPENLRSGGEQKTIHRHPPERLRAQGGQRGAEMVERRNGSPRGKQSSRAHAPRPVF